MGKNLTLTGMMGVGKSTIGKILAKKLEYKFVDVDKLIENKENTEILPYIFGEFNSKNFLNFKKNISQSKFSFGEFKMLYFFSSNRWDILTNDDILIKLPQGNISKSLNLAYKIIGSNDFKNKNIIDLRIDNHLIVK